MPSYSEPSNQVLRSGNTLTQEVVRTFRDNLKAVISADSTAPKIRLPALNGSKQINLSSEFTFHQYRDLDCTVEVKFPVPESLRQGYAWPISSQITSLDVMLPTHIHRGLYLMERPNPANPNNQWFGYWVLPVKEDLKVVGKDIDLREDNDWTIRYYLRFTEAHPNTDRSNAEQIVRGNMTIKFVFFTENLIDE